MIYMNVKCSDLTANSVLSEEDVAWAANVRIPYNSSNGEWAKLQRIQMCVVDALSAGTIKEVDRESVKIMRGPQIISDDLGIQGVFNPANGKTYDSKSQYYRAVKEAGCEVLGTDAPREAKPIEAKICENDLKRDIAQAIQQLGG